NGNEAACTAQFIQTLGKRAYRRPLSADEVDRYTALFAVARSTGDFASGVSLVIRAMLQSPYFLYRVELGAAGAQPEPDGAVPLSQYEVASRLSYFIWDSMPDDRLLAAADANQLGDPKRVAELVRQMLTDPKARDGLGDFHLQ